MVSNSDFQCFNTLTQIKDIPDSHTNRYRLFTLVYGAAVNNGQAHILPLMDTFGDDELFIYNKVNRLNCDLSRKNSSNGGASKTISKASDKVFGRKKRQQEDFERKQILKNQKTIMEMQKQILDRLGTKE